MVSGRCPVVSKDPALATDHWALTTMASYIHNLDRESLLMLYVAGELPAEGTADLRYRGQSFELSVPLQPALAQAFHREHEERYGYADPSREIELVAVRTAQVVPGPEVSLEAASDHEVMGPLVLELAGATCWVPDGWHGETNADGTLVLTR